MARATHRHQAGGALRAAACTTAAWRACCAPGSKRKDFEVFQHAQVSPGDGGLSYGQAVVAAAILRSESANRAGRKSRDDAKDSSKVFTIPAGFSVACSRYTGLAAVRGLDFRQNTVLSVALLRACRSSVSRFICWRSPCAKLLPFQLFFARLYSRLLRSELENLRRAGDTAAASRRHSRDHHDIESLLFFGVALASLVAFVVGRREKLESGEDRCRRC